LNHNKYIVGIWKNIRIKASNIPDAQEYDPVFTHEGNKIIMPQFELFERGELSKDELMNGMVEAVHRHHDAGLRHGDLNRGNFMINIDNRVVLIDFETTKKHYNDKEEIKRDLYQAAVSIIKIHNSLFKKNRKKLLILKENYGSRYEKEIAITNRFLKLTKNGFDDDRWETIKRIKEVIKKLFGDRN